MADERDPQVSRRYRELGSEAPPPALDEVILAASRRAVAPRRRWYLPLAAAAVALLGIGIAVQVDRERADPEGVTAPSEADERPSQTKPGPAREAQPQAKRRESPRELLEKAPAKREQRPSEDAASRGARSERDSLFSPEAPPAPAAAPPAIPRTAPVLRDHESPERLIERIVELRNQDRHEEADKALAEFKRRHPDYAIPESMRESVERK